jgi:hypothetical protein
MSSEFGEISSGHFIRGYYFFKLKIPNSQLKT